MTLSFSYTSLLWLAMSATQAVAQADAPPTTVPPEEFGFPTAANNNVLGVAFDLAEGGEALSVQPGQLFGTAGKSEVIVRSSVPNVNQN